MGINRWSHWTLKKKAVVAIVALSLLATAAMGLTSYIYGSNLALKKILNLTEEKIMRDAWMIQARLLERRADLQILRDVPPVQGIIRSTDHNGIDPQTGEKGEFWYGRLGQIFASFLTGRPVDFLELRFLDEEGRELVHAVTVDQQVKIMPRDKIGRRIESPDVVGAMKLKAGGIYISDIALLRERGKVVAPHQPVIMMATPVYDERDRFRGAIAATIHARAMYENISAGADGTVKYLTNEDGYFLAHPDRGKEFGFDLGFNYTIRNQHQHLTNEMMVREAFIGYDKKKHHIDGMKRIFFDPGDKRRFWTIYYEVPEGIALNDVYVMQQAMIFAGFVITFLAIVIFLWLTSREVLNPLSQIVAAAGKMENGDLTVRLPEEGAAREFLQVNRTLNAFAGKQEEAVESFEAELALRMQELGGANEKMKMLSSAVEQSLESVVITDRDGKIEYVNPAFEIISGYSRVEAIGNNPRVLKSGRHPREFYKELWDTITNGGVWHGEFINRRKDRTLYHEEATISPIRNERGVITHFVAIKSDTTKQKMVQEALEAKNKELELLTARLQEKHDEISTQNMLLEQANRTKSEFLSNMSHELRTPLNAIIGFAELLKDGVLGGLDEGQRSSITDIFDSGQHLLSLINDILDLSKIEEGKMTLDLEQVDIRMAIEGCLSVVEGKAAERHIGTGMAIDADIGLVMVDARKFRQIVLNLLSNAVKFTPDGGNVRIRAGLLKNGDMMPHRVPISPISPLAEVGDFLEIEVTDTGIGMTGEGMQKLFKPFEQIDGSITRKYGGSGLGLAIVKKIAELHGGTVTVESEPGKGSVFTVLLPCRLALQEGGDSP